MDTMEYIITVLKTLVNIPSPSGYTKEVMEFVEKEAEEFGYRVQYNNRGGLLIQDTGKEE